MIRELTIGLLLLAGATLMLFSAVGLLRFRDVLCRAHALTKATTFGICLMLLAFWIHFGNEVSGLKLGLILAFSLLTIPLSSHLIAMLLYRETRKKNTPPPITAESQESTR